MTGGRRGVDIGACTEILRWPLWRSRAGGTSNPPATVSGYSSRSLSLVNSCGWTGVHEAVDIVSVSMGACICVCLGEVNVSILLTLV